MFHGVGLRVGELFLLKNFAIFWLSQKFRSLWFLIATFSADNKSLREKRQAPLKIVD